MTDSPREWADKVFVFRVGESGYPARMGMIQRWLGGQQELAESAGVSVSTAKSWSLKGTEMGLFVAGKLARNSGLSLGYILSGRPETLKDIEVEMLRFEEAKSAFAIPSSVPERKEARQLAITEAQRQLDELAIQLADGGLVESAEIVMLPRYDIQASAGHGRQVAEAVPEMERVPFRRDWLREHGINPAYAQILTNRGSSMLEIQDGAPIIVDTEPGKPIHSGCIYAIVLDGDLLVKAVSRNIDGTIDLISSNPLFPKQTITQDRFDQLNIVGRVFWTGKWL